MKEHNVEQGSVEWFKLRMNIPTASCFHRVITPKRGNLASGRWSYAIQLVAARLLNYQPTSLETLDHIRDGKDNEPAAVRQLEFVHDLKTRKAGFVTADSGRIGASPDRFVVDSMWPVECKAPTVPTHLRYLLAAEIAEFQYQDKVREREAKEREREERIAAAVAEGKKVRKPAPLKDLDPDDFVSELEFVYRCQRQGQIWLCEADAGLFYSFHDRQPECFVRTDRDQSFIKRLDDGLDQFCDEVDALTERAKALGAFQPYDVATPVDRDLGDGIRTAPMETAEELAELIDGARGDRLAWGG